MKDDKKKKLALAMKSKGRSPSSDESENPYDADKEYEEKDVYESDVGVYVLVNEALKKGESLLRPKQSQEDFDKESQKMVKEQEEKDKKGYRK